MDRWVENLIAGLQAGQATDAAGSGGSVDLALSERLLNRAIAERLPPGGAVQDVQVRPEAGRARVTVRMARPRFLPAMTLMVTVERQPDLPTSPLLVLRLGMPAGLGLLFGVGANLFNALPPGLKLEGERLTVDLASLLRQQDLGWLLTYARHLTVTFEPGRVRIQGNAEVD
jgi:hypothetical protein